MTAPLNPQVAAWSTGSPDDLTLVRLYADGTKTVERKVDGRYTGEVELERAAVAS